MKETNYNTSDGKKIPISKMNEIHLKNAISKSRREARESRSILINGLNIMSYILGTRCKAYDEISIFITKLEKTTYKDFVNPIHFKLIEELNSRNK